MINSVRDITIALCLETSEKNGSRITLTVAEFYELISAIDRYNRKNGLPAQISLFDENKQPKIKFEHLLELEVDFMTQELYLEEDLSQKIYALIKRMSSVSFELEKLESQAIRVCTVFDEDYPEKLKVGLKNMPNSLREPPILYCCGDLSIANRDFVGFVGARDVNPSDIEWTRAIVRRISEEALQKRKIWGVVSGGAEGTDRIAEDAALTLSMPVIEFSKNMRSTIKNNQYFDAVLEKRMLLLSEVNPLRKLSRLEATSHFMNRNKYIYAVADYTIVVKSAVGQRSGTWMGATEAIKRRIGKVFVRDSDEVGNQDLIKIGAKPIFDSRKTRKS